MDEKALSELGLFLQYVQNDKRAKDIKKMLLRKSSRWEDFDIKSCSFVIALDSVVFRLI